MQNSEIPLRMYTSDVLKVSKLSYAALRAKQKRGEFPAHVDRGREYIYDGRQVYQALGLIDGPLSANPWD